MLAGIGDESSWIAKPRDCHARSQMVLLRNENQQMILDALAALPVHYREVILLCEAEELSYREIAEVLSLPIGTVMSRLSRARNSLRLMLAAKQSARATV